MTDFCNTEFAEKIRILFGKPKEGIHSYRIYDIAVLDFIVTLVAAKLLEYSGIGIYTFVFNKSLGSWSILY